MLSATIGVNVRRYRTERGLSQEKLAYESSVSVKCVSMIERGKENVTIDIVESISKVLGVHPAQLVTEVE